MKCVQKVFINAKKYQNHTYFIKQNHTISTTG